MLELVLPLLIRSRPDILQPLSDLIEAWQAVIAVKLKLTRFSPQSVLNFTSTDLPPCLYSVRGT